MHLYRKSILVLFSIVMTATLAGCTFWTNGLASSNSDQKNIIEDSSTISLEGVDEIQITGDFSVCDFSLEKSSEDVISYEQTYNNDALKVNVSSKKEDNVLFLNMENSSNSVLINMKLCTFYLYVPEDIDLIVEIDSDIGDQNFDFSGLSPRSIQASSDVGDLNLFGDDHAEALDYIDLSSDIGDLSVKLENTSMENGEIKLTSNVGDILLSTTGISGHASADFEEYTSSLLFNGIDFGVFDDYNFGTTDESSDTDVYISADIGSITFDAN